MRHSVTAGALLLLLCLFCVDQSAWAQEKELELIVVTAENHPLSSLQDAADFVRANPPVLLFNEIPNFTFKPDTRSQAGEGIIGSDPLIQPFNPLGPTNILTQFDGADNTDNGANVTPPDTDGDVSSDAVDRYVQMINIVTEVFDKNGVSQGGGAFFSNAFWTGLPGICASNNNGDPIVLYDETADRWLVSQFAFNSTSVPPWRQCVAVSQTSDPLGAYNRYEFSFDAIGFPDYPKHGIVTDDVTLMANLFSPGFIGTFIGAIDKNAMYTGAAATLVGTNLGGAEFGFVAGDLDDPSGTAGNVGALFGTAMTANGLFDVWEIVPDYGTPGNTTFTRIERVPIAAFDSDICPAFRERCVPHPGSGSDLETLSGRLMHRLQIRDFGTHLSMLTAHTVDVDAAPPGGNGRTGIRWYELRSTDGGANWTLHQEGTHGPADGLDRWMASIAMNAAGDIGIGFMTSSAATPVEIRVTGQTAAQSGTGTFDADEGICRAGVAGADWSGRAGDYSATNVDPDSDTFWHTNEFGRSTVSRGWGTAVCEFDLGGGPPPPFTINIKKLKRTVSGNKKIKMEWTPGDVTTNKVDFYVTIDPAQPAPDGNPKDEPGGKRTSNDGKTSLKLQPGDFPTDGPFNVQACEKKSTTVCSNIVQADFTGVPVDVNEPEFDDDDEGPDAREDVYTVEQVGLANYPNPFNPSTIISYQLPEAENVSLKVFNVLGQQVQTLVNGYQEAGEHRAAFIADQLSAGVYFYVLQAGTFSQTKRMTLIK